MTPTIEQRLERLERALYGRKAKQKGPKKAKAQPFGDEKQVMDKLFKRSLKQH